MKGTTLNFTRWVLLAVIALSGWFHYRGMLSSVVAHIQAPDEEMTHALVAPLISLSAIMLRCRKFRKEAGLPSWRGFGWVVFFLVVAWVGAGGGYGRVSQVSMIGLIWSIPYAFWGRGVGRLMLFPVWFLLFTVPVSLDGLIVHLRIIAAVGAVGILNGFGMEIVREGTLIFSQVEGAEFYLDVADPCSGIRSLSMMMLLVGAYTQFILKSRFQRWVVFACSIPVAVLGNVFRVSLVCLVAYHLGQEAAEGVYHDSVGYAVFYAAVLTVTFSVEKTAERIDSWLQKKRLLPQYPSAQDTAADASPKHPLAVVALATALAVLTFSALCLFYP